MAVDVKLAENARVAPSDRFGPMAAKPAENRPQPRSYDLRERKRTRTRLMIQTEALRLFAEQGYAQTTIEEIADAAAISPRTFFRYFPSKEDVVLWDEYDPLALDLLGTRPVEEPFAEAFRAVIREMLGGLYRHDPERLRARIQLAFTVPEVRARFLDAQTHGIEELVEWVAESRGARVDDLSLRVAGSALLAAVWVAFDVWQRDGGETDLLALFDQTSDALAALARELSVRPAGPS